MMKLFYKTLLLFVLILSTTLLYQKNTYAYHTLVHIDPIPHTKMLISQEKYVDAHTYLSYFMDFEYMQDNKEAHDLIKKIATVRSSLKYTSQKIAQGISTGTSDELLGQVSAIGSDFFFIGDIRDLALEGTHFFKDEEVDAVIISLSTIGLVASASTLFTLGSSAIAKSAVSVLKLAHKSKRIPLWLNTYLLKHSKTIRKTKSLASISPLFITIKKLEQRVGLQEMLKLLSQSTNFKELQSITKLSKRYGANTHTLLKLSHRKVLSHASYLKKSNIKTIKIASSYGSNGFVHLIKGGEKNFITTTKRLKAFAKIGYKGELWKIFLWLMKHLSDTMLMLIMGVSSLLLLPWRRRQAKR